MLPRTAADVPKNVPGMTYAPIHDKHTVHGCSRKEVAVVNHNDIASPHGMIPARRSRGRTPQGAGFNHSQLPQRTVVSRQYLDGTGGTTVKAETLNIISTRSGKAPQHIDGTGGRVVLAETVKDTWVRCGNVP